MNCCEFRHSLFFGCCKICCCISSSFFHSNMREKCELRNFHCQLGRMIWWGETIELRRRLNKFEEHSEWHFKQRQAELMSSWGGWKVENNTVFCESLCAMTFVHLASIAHNSSLLILNISQTFHRSRHSRNITCRLLNIMSNSRRSNNANEWRRLRNLLFMFNRITSRPRGDEQVRSNGWNNEMNVKKSETIEFRD